MATYNKTQLSTDPQILLKDLFCTGDFMKTAIITLNYNITNFDIPLTTSPP